MGNGNTGSRWALRCFGKPGEGIVHNSLGLLSGCCKPLLPPDIETSRRSFRPSYRARASSFHRVSYPLNLENPWHSCYRNSCIPRNPRKVSDGSFPAVRVVHFLLSQNLFAAHATYRSPFLVSYRCLR